MEGEYESSDEDNDNRDLDSNYTAQNQFKMKLVLQITGK